MAANKLRADSTLSPTLRVTDDDDNEEEEDEGLRQGAAYVPAFSRL